MNTLGMKGTKWELFVKAVELFADHSYSLVSMRDLAEAVGIRASSIYNHFSSKDEILEQIYEFYAHYMEGSAADVNKVLADVEKGVDPKKIFKQTGMSFPKEVRQLMAQVMLIISNQAQFDKRADVLLKKYVVDRSRQIWRPVLQRMMELDKIEPLDIETFLHVYSSYQYSSVCQFYTRQDVDAKQWLKGIEMIFSFIKIK